MRACLKNNILPNTAIVVLTGGNNSLLVLMSPSALEETLHRNVPLAPSVRLVNLNVFLRRKDASFAELSNQFPYRDSSNDSTFTD